MSGVSGKLENPCRLPKGVNIRSLMYDERYLGKTRTFPKGIIGNLQESL